jgi:phosphotransferase system HPr (HPr) family protein
MSHKKLTIRNDEGLQSKAAALLVQVAGRFSSNVWIEQADKRINAKSIMGVLSLKLRKGDVFTIVAIGSDEEEAVTTLTRLIETGEA